MSRLTNKDYKTSNIDQILCGAKTNKSFNEILDDHNRILIENALHKLAEYENLGSVKEIKQLKHELEVYKRALELAEQTIRRICPPIAIGGIVPEHFNDTKDSEYFLDQARKELEDERKTNG